MDSSSDSKSEAERSRRSVNGPTRSISAASLASRAEMRDGLIGIEGKFVAAAVVNHGWSLSQADRLQARVVNSPWFVCGEMLRMKRRDFVKTMTAAGVGMALRP